MNKKLFSLKSQILTLLVFISITSISQKDENRIDITSFDVTNISISAPVQKIKLSIPVSSVRIYDSRFDTSSLGIAQNGMTNRLRLIKMKKSLVHEVKAYYYQLAEPIQHDSGTIELSCFVKKLILSDHIYIVNPEEEKLPSKKFDIAEKSGIHFIGEFYAKLNDAYIPLCRFDTVITGNKNIIWRGDKYLKDALTAALQKVSSINGRRSLSMVKN